MAQSVVIPSDQRIHQAKELAGVSQADLAAAADVGLVMTGAAAAATRSVAVPAALSTVLGTIGA